MKQKRIGKIFVVAVITTFLISNFTAIAINVKNQNNVESELNNDPYTGHLRVYVVEPVSRWDDYDGNPYHYGFLDLAIDETLSIEYQDSYNTQVTWDAQQAGYENVEEENIMVMAAIFNPKSHKKYSFPPLSHPFNAYYVDAAAAATPGTTGYNTVTQDFTHTVFIEEGTGTWCKPCVQTSESLYTISESGDYPFYFVALIQDKVQKAADRLENDYNIFAYPACYCDGGYEVVVGGSTVETFRGAIESSGSRDVHEFDLSISLVWAGSGILDIDVTITNNEETVVNNQGMNSPPTTPEIDGPRRGKPGQELTYTVVSTDPDGDDITYCFKWDDGSGEICIGPFPSGEPASISHTWEEEGTYLMECKASDPDGAESDPATAQITIPRNRPRLFRLFELFPNAFPFLRQLVGL